MTGDAIAGIEEQFRIAGRRDQRTGGGEIALRNEPIVCIHAVHLFADSSLADYDEAAATLLEQRVLSFLERVQPVR